MTLLYLPIGGYDPINFVTAAVWHERAICLNPYELEIANNLAISIQESCEIKEARRKLKALLSSLGDSPATVLVTSRTRMLDFPREALDLLESIPQDRWLRERQVISGWAHLCLEEHRTASEYVHAAMSAPRNLFDESELVHIQDESELVHIQEVVELAVAANELQCAKELMDLQSKTDLDFRWMIVNKLLWLAIHAADREFTQMRENAQELISLRSEFPEVRVIWDCRELRAASDRIDEPQCRGLLSGAIDYVLGSISRDEFREQISIHS